VFELRVLQPQLLSLFLHSFFCFAPFKTASHGLWCSYCASLTIVVEIATSLTISGKWKTPSSFDRQTRKERKIVFNEMG
jgi:hypothetical protein